ncbi:hypothetical protein GCM10007890_00830 [Methylobacterium tardum]|uniref:Uncharacterized protein n=2 Tax=Methylobacterium tardum TaxID=374432 RepID=A0AA37TDP4_9HYPH|nr:hypothetical protein GCM10007890_00830 [Methylobacterium tardum]
MRAEIEDRFSGPLKSLRAQLLDTSRQGAAHGEALAKGLNKAEAAAQATANTAKTVLNPALAAIGVTGLDTGVAVAGVVNALNSLGSSLSSLGQLGRETGMAADQLRVFQSVAGKFGVSGDASSAAAKTFSQNMRDIRRGVGETMGFLNDPGLDLGFQFKASSGTLLPSRMSAAGSRPYPRLPEVHAVLRARDGRVSR